MAKNSGETIKTTALEMFREKGYDNVTIQDICEACGITKPTFYHYISAKEDLIVDVYTNIIQDMLMETYELFELKSSYAQLTLIFVRLIRKTKEFGWDFFGKLINANLNENRHSFALNENLRKVAESIIRNAQESGEIQNTNDPAQIYRAIAFVFMGVEVNWCIARGDFPFEKVFFTNMNAVTMVRDDLKDTWKEYFKD